MVKTEHDNFMKAHWKKEAAAEEMKYQVGRGMPGSGGLVIGDVKIRLRVNPLQGIQRDPATGAAKKKYGESEADIPIQVAK